MADFFYQPPASCVDPVFLCNSPNYTVPSLIEDTTTGCYPSHSLHESCSHETSTQLLITGNQFDSISCMNLNAECESFVIEVESTVKRTNRPEQGNGMNKKRKATAKNWPSNSSQCPQKAQRKKQRKCVKSENKVVLEAPPGGYVHVRARRGEATDSHSLAERVRREKISERMKLLQGLVPGGDKVTGKALLLDEIINYVQSLQNQVEFLSMKLASLCPLPSNFGVSSENGSGYLPQLEIVRELSHFSTDVIGNHQNSFNNSGDSSFSGLQDYEIVENDVSVIAHGQRPNDIGIAQDRTSIIWNMERQNQRFMIDEVGYNLRSSQQ